MYDTQLNHVQNQQFNVDQVAFTSESIQDTLNTVSAMKAASAAQKQVLEKFDMDEIEDVMDDMADMMADQEEIQEMMGRNFGVEYDEADIMQELNELDEELIGDQLNEGLGLPSYIPQNQNAAGANANQPAAANKNPSEAEALENMMQI